MSFREILDQLNLIKRARKYNISIWQYPPFLFTLIGFIIILTILLSYVIGTRYFPPEYVVFWILGITSVLFIIDYIIVNSFERLAEVNLMKTEFINIISHQLRTPLSNLKWTLDLALKEADPTRVKNSLEIIKEQNARMIGLINDMIYTYQIEQGKWIFKIGPTDFKIVIKETVRDFIAFAKSNNIDISIDIEENLPKVLTDPQKISHVMSNLLSNAIRYSKSKGRVNIKVERDRSHVRCEIQDEGVGIPEEDQKYIFKKFFRGKRILKHRTEGMGLGLFIAKSIIDASKGKIGFKSEKDKGSLFWFKLPINK